MTRPVTIISLDIGASTGWMVRMPDGKRYCGSWKFPSVDPTGYRLLKLYKSLYSLLVEFEIKEHEVWIAIEEAKFIKHPAAQILGTKLIAAVELFAATYGFPVPKLVTVQEWRNPFLKYDGFLASPRPPKGTDNTTEWYKRKTMEQCFKLGMAPENDNEADAIGIGWWLHDGGAKRQKERKEREKDIKKQKRAQAEMKL